MRSSGSTKIGCTKILKCFWMEESKRMVSVKIGSKHVFLPTRFYDAPSGWVVETFMSILAVEIEGIQAQKWNNDRVVIFQSVILLRFRLITGAKKICAWIDLQLYFWICYAFDKLIKNTYTVDTGYQGRSCRTQSEYGWIKCPYTMYITLIGADARINTKYLKTIIRSSLGRYVIWRFVWGTGI